MGLSQDGRRSGLVAQSGGVNRELNDSGLGVGPGGNS
jgi:hypothetical protein